MAQRSNKRALLVGGGALAAAVIAYAAIPGIKKADRPRAAAPSGRDSLASSKSKYRLFDTKSDAAADRKSTRLNSSHVVMSYAVFCLTKQKSA